jgi:hypothetical protein
MPTEQQREQQRDNERQERDHRDALIRERVLRALGRPSGPHRVQVRRLWEDYYRVNVFLGGDALSTRIANSYFVEADGDGNIVESTPAITKQY